MGKRLYANFANDPVLNDMGQTLFSCMSYLTVSKVLQAFVSWLDCLTICVLMAGVLIYFLANSCSAVLDETSQSLQIA